MKKILLLLAMLAASLVPLSVASPAHAAYITSDPSWCNGTAYKKSNTWGINNAANGASDAPNFRLDAYAIYWYCPNGTGSTKIRVIQTTFCAKKTSDEYSDHVNGVKWNAYYVNDYGKVVNPPEMRLDLPNSGIPVGRQYCQAQAIPSADQETWYMYSNPKWSLSGWYDINLWPDDEFTFREDGYAYHWITPNIDKYLTYP